VRTIVGELPPLAGQLTIGASVRVGYLAQADAKLDLESSVLDALLQTRNLPLSKARSFLRVSCSPATTSTSASAT